MTDSTTQVLLEYARRQEQIRVRRAIRSRLRKLMPAEANAASARALKMAEVGGALPIHFDVRIVSGDIVVQKRFSLLNVTLSPTMFAEDGLTADDWTLLPRPKSINPHFVHERVVPLAGDEPLLPRRGRRNGR